MTIFFAVKLTKAELPEWFDWILVAFVAFHVVVHVVLSVSSNMSSSLAENAAGFRELTQDLRPEFVIMSNACKLYIHTSCQHLFALR